MTLGSCTVIEYPAFFSLGVRSLCIYLHVRARESQLRIVLMCASGEGKNRKHVAACILGTARVQRTFDAEGVDDQVLNGRCRSSFIPYGYTAGTICILTCSLLPCWYLCEYYGKIRGVNSESFNICGKEEVIYYIVLYCYTQFKLIFCINTFYYSSLSLRVFEKDEKEHLRI